MPRKRHTFDVDDAIQQYIAGESGAKVAAQFGVNPQTIYDALAARGIPRRPRGSGVNPRRITLPNSIVSDYEQGTSVLAIATQYGVSRNVVERELARQGVTTRGPAEAQAVRYAAMTAEERQRLAAAAHDAVRGRKASWDELCRRAQAREAVGAPPNASPGQQFIESALRERGVGFIPEKAVGKYNVDMAVGAVAVEVLGGHFHASKRHHAERFKYIADQGWLIVCVWDTKLHPIEIAAVEYVIAMEETSSRDPSLAGQYRMIRGDAKLLAAGSPYDDDFALKPPASRS